MFFFVLNHKTALSLISCFCNKSLGKNEKFSKKDSQPSPFLLIICWNFFLRLTDQRLIFIRMIRCLPCLLLCLQRFIDHFKACHLNTPDNQDKFE